MRISRYFVTGYKNLIDCDIRPNGLHALTGCNGTGKSNLLESLSFLDSIISGSESEREKVFIHGVGLNNTQWLPMNGHSPVQPHFIVEGELELEQRTWEFAYSLQFSIPEMDSPYDLSTPLKLFFEEFKLKEKGKPGVMKTIISRDSKSNAVAKLEAEARKQERFNVIENMSCLTALKTREASAFILNFPLTNLFLTELNLIRVISLNPTQLFSSNNTFSRKKQFKIGSGAKDYINSISLYPFIKEIKKDEQKWLELEFWANEVLRITRIAINEETSSEDDTLIHQTLLLMQDNKSLWPHELSTGSIVLLALICLLISPSHNGRVLLIEEPEAYIHPKAIVDIMTLIREVASDDNTIIISTHNPVVLNTLNPDQVTLLSLDDNNMTRTSLVSEIKEATDALGRGYINFGDLLEINFRP
jgi:AAA15 family ATPase/GTPase